MSRIYAESELSQRQKINESELSQLIFSLHRLSQSWDQQNFSQIAWVTAFESSSKMISKLIRSFFRSGPIVRSLEVIEGQIFPI